MKHRLYIKELPNGLMYLGYTQKEGEDFENYLGSGKIWKSNIKKYNYTKEDILTFILFETDNTEELQERGIFYSKYLNVVNSNKWANLTEEQGQGNAYWTGKKRPDIFKSWENKEHWTKRPEVREKIAKSVSKLVKSEESKNKVSIALTGRPKSQEHKDKLAEGKLGDKNPSFGKVRGLSSSSKKVLDIKSGQVFDSYLDAADYYGVHYTAVSRWVKKEENFKLI